MTAKTAGMTFSEALDLLRAGYKLRRAIWDLQSYIEMVEPGGEHPGVRYLRIKTDKVEAMPWYPSNQAMFAGDWTIAPNSKRIPQQPEAVLCET